MSTLLIVGGGLFGSLAAAHAREKGIEAIVFDAQLSGRASPAAAGLFKEEWAGRKLQDHFREALPLLERLAGVGSTTLTHPDGRPERFLLVPPRLLLERNPIAERVTSVGDGWLDVGGRRLHGHVLVAAGIWCQEFFPHLGVYGKAGSSFLFAGEREGRIQEICHGRQAIAFVRDPETTFFSDGTAERDHTAHHEEQALARAAALGLSDPIARFWGQRPYTPGGPRLERVGSRTWVATGGRKMGTILGAAFAVRLIREMGL
jgi:glycine/D-amino acid oxidase-like deaminating enzyme